MPGAPHEVLIAALREQPSLLVDLLSRVAHARATRGMKPVDSAVRFVKTAEIRPDLLLTKGRRWSLVEVQRRRDPAKRRRWLLAASVLLDQTGVLGDVIVITARADVARWALSVAQIETRMGTRLSLAPVVLHLGGPAIEAMLDARQPQLALFAAWAMHARHGPGARRVVERAIGLTERMPPPLRGAQMRAIVSVLSTRMHAQLKEASMNPDNIPETAAGRRTRLFILAQERKHAVVEGRMKGQQDAILAVLEKRGIRVTAKDRATIRACFDLSVLAEWVERSAIAESLAEVLARKAAPRAKRAASRRATAPAATRRR